MEVKGFSWRSVDGVSVLVPDFFEPLGLRGGYSIRVDDSGNDLDLDLRGEKDKAQVLNNRRRVAAACGVDAGKLVLAEQVHGGAVAMVTRADEGRGATSPAETIRGVDGLITTERHLPLATLSADCVLVLLADEKRRAVASVHSGWPSTVAGVVPAAVAHLSHLGVEPCALYAAIGPSIRQGAYEVGEDLYEKFAGAFTWADEVFTMVGAKLHLDLAGAVKRQLCEAGVAEERIRDSGLCTFERNEMLYSFRKDGRAAGRTAGVIEIHG
jgi:polyphenol oxidase